MTTDQQLERIVRSWLEPGLTTLTDDVLDRVLDQLPATPQRRPALAPRRIRHVGSYAKFSLAAAAVVVIAIVGINLATRPGPPEVAGPTTSPGVESQSPSAAPSPARSRRPPAAPAAVPLAASAGPMDSGSYRWVWPGGQVTFAVPEGWTATADGIAKDINTGHKVELIHYLPGDQNEVTRVYSDACQSYGQLKEVGTQVDDLLTAVEEQVGTDIVKSAEDTVVGTADGKWVHVRESAGVDRSTCRYGVDGPLQIWAGLNSGTGSLGLAPGFEAALYAFDFEGERVVFSGTFRPEDLAELDAIVSSFEFATLAEAIPPGPLRLPSTVASPAGAYGWESGPGGTQGMHKVVREGQYYREATELIFSVGSTCRTAIEDQAAQPLQVGGLTGVFVERNDPPVTFGSPDGDEITRAHALAVGDRTLCVYLTSHQDTSEGERQALLQILEGIRAWPVGNDRIRVTFTLDEGWDIG